LLVPFLEKGSTTAIVPISTPAEVLGTLTLLSLDPGRPLGQDDIELARSVVGQAALALENARLYQQQKAFADTMQRSLLPHAHPRIEGLELGAVYESSARLDIGGDVYDFLTLEDGRLAVALGDVAGHGIDAAADMAMAKFVFRSLAREHPDPEEFLAAANEVVLGEVGPTKFITMLYLTIDPSDGSAACACAGHPWPRVVERGGSVRALTASGLALGVEPSQSYAAAREQLPVGAAVVLYTDGVIEARRDGELYGDERLDALLAAKAHLPTEALARAVVEDCRAFAGGELTDDCAVVVVRRTA
jgi:serine phosphatase RsbU (regulator of sigma subunit)